MLATRSDSGNVGTGSEGGEGGDGGDGVQFGDRPKKPVWIGFKGGNGQSNHNDLDAGTFIFEMEGHRWAVDLGADSYGLSGYWDKSAAAGKRYSYYRKSTAGHNTLTFNANDLHPGWSAQDPQGVAAISTFSCGGSSGGDRGIGGRNGAGASRLGKEVGGYSGYDDTTNEPHATLDLTPVYTKAGGHVEISTQKPLKNPLEDTDGLPRPLGRVDGRRTPSVTS